MKKSVDQTFLRAMNRSITLHLLRFRSPISRTDISLESGLNKASVTAVISDLMTEDYVHEIGQGQSFGSGRRPVLLQFNGSAGYVVGVEVGVGTVRCAVTDLNAHIVVYEDHVLADNASLHDIIDVIIRLVRSVCVRTPPSHHGIVGVGVAVPGLVDYNTGLVWHAPNLDWRDVALGELLARELEFPILIDNEANVATLAEQMYGCGRDFPYFVYISGGVGIGAGIIEHGELMRGHQGMAGEFGHMTIQMDGPLCRCGNRGCLEVYASKRAIVERYAALAGHKIDWLTLLDEVQQGEQIALQCVETTAKYLGTGILNIVSGLNPGAIIIGNHLALLKEKLTDPISRMIEQRSLGASHASVEVRSSALGADASLLGAAALAINRHFARPLQVLQE